MLEILRNCWRTAKVTFPFRVASTLYDTEIMMAHPVIRGGR